MDDLSDEEQDRWLEKQNLEGYYIPPFPGRHGDKGIYSQNWSHWGRFFGHDKLKRSTLKRTLEQWENIAQELADKDGFLPPCSKLDEMGFHGLRQIINKHKERFSRYLRVGRNAGSKQISFSTWMTIAKRLSELNQKLPHASWLERNGYKGVRNSMMNHPELFKDIDQYKLGGFGSANYKSMVYIDIPEEEKRQLGLLPQTDDPSC